MRRHLLVSTTRLVKLAYDPAKIIRKLRFIPDVANIIRFPTPLSPNNGLVQRTDWP